MNKHLEIAYQHLVNGLNTFEVNSPQWKFCLTSLIGYGGMVHELTVSDDDDDGECDLCARCQCSS
jgi:hypothetical protein